MKETKVYIGIGLRRLRKEKGWTVEDLALESYLTRKYIYELEHNLKSPSSTTLDNLAKAFEMRFGEFNTEIENEIIRK
ncbi:helix-turn-helix domain-containing protein [Neobacillus niacini]|uniref:helix-turn-helix domain-containing protein n=1 Tax=Neobacillus niacini TaxID=86668 RepID=UPI001C8DAE02|nr:helix-turn-helix transcriptional regulator [Neobacillus niacini]MBY0145106.1 helix-turn-helix transcriptional regulator [Neobacillus niacini]